MLAYRKSLVLDTVTFRANPSLTEAVGVCV